MAAAVFLTMPASASRFSGVIWAVVPATLMLFVSVGPLVYSFILSFFRWKMDLPFSKPVFIGLGNYISLVQDPVMHE